MSGQKEKGRSRSNSSSSIPSSLQRGGSFNSSSSSDSKHQGISLSQLTHFMSFPHRSSRKDDKATDVATLKEEFDRKIQAVVVCLEEKAEENIDLARKLKTLQDTSKQKEADKDRVIEDLQKALKAKEEECSLLEKKGSDEVLNELNRRIQTITHCLNDMAEENLKLRTTVNANANAAAANGKAAAKNSNIRNSAPPSASPFSPPPPSSSSSFSVDHETSSSASFLSSLTASSTILSVSRSTTSNNSSTSAPSSSSAPSTPSKPSPNTNKPPPATATVSTSTSPTPAHNIATPAATAPTIPITLSSSANSVAEMKSEILAEEFLKDPEWLKKFSDTYLVPPPAAQSLSLLSDIIKQDKLRVESRVKLSLDERIKELETGLKEHETNVTTMKEKLDKEKDRTGSLTESVTEYEKKLKDLEGRMWDNLNKEAQRRTDAESKAKRLKKKVDELQFLLDELKDDGSDEDEDDDEPANENNNNEESNTTDDSNTATSTEETSDSEPKTDS